MSYIIALKLAIKLLCFTSNREIIVFMYNINEGAPVRCS